MRQIVLNVPHDYALPPFYLEGKDIGLALKLGAEAVGFLHKRAAETVRATTHAEAVKQATEEFDLERKEAEATQQKLRQQLLVTQARVNAMELAAGQQRAEVQKEVRSSVQELLTAKDEQISRLQLTLESSMEGMGKKVESLQHSMTKTFASSKEKGTLGEVLMERLLKVAYDCDIQIVSKGAETADIRMTRPAAAYFWEVKNYTRMVSAEEVNKFRRDLRLHPDVRGGILVSLRQGIVGKSRGGDIELEFQEDGRFILFLSSFMVHEDPVFYLQTLRPFFETIEAMAKPVKEEAEAIRSLEMKAALMTNLLRSHALSITKHKNSLVGHKRRTDAMFAEFSGYILEEEAQLQTVLRVAMGASEEVQAETDTYLSALVFRKERLSDCVEDRTREFVKWLLSVAEMREGTQMEIKDLLDKAKAAGYSEKWVRGLREDLFHETAWAKGSRFVMGMRFNPETTQ